MVTDTIASWEYMTTTPVQQQGVDAWNQFAQPETLEVTVAIVATVVIGEGVSALKGKVEKVVLNGAGAANLHRPYIRNSKITTVKNNTIEISDKFVDPNTGKIIEGTYNLGHKYGHEFYKYKAWAESKGLTQQQFNELTNNSNIYQIEDTLSNQSHLFEAPPNIFYGGN